LKVKIPFKERFKEPMLKGTKIFTSRTKRCGQNGDVFEAFGHEFEIVDTSYVRLETVSDFWEEEGCESKEDFIEVWKQIHPRKGFVPEQRVFVHQFRRMSK